jgi:hypothetical protein
MHSFSILLWQLLSRDYVKEDCLLLKNEKLSKARILNSAVQFSPAALVAANVLKD